MANYNSSFTGAQIDSAVERTNSTDVTAGTITASKTVVVDSNKDITGFRNITATGTITADSFTATGNTTIGDAATDTIAINSTITTDLIFEGSSADANELTLTPGNPSADRTITLPDATDTLVGKATTDTLTNKTLTSAVLNTADINTPDIDGGTVDAITSLTVANNVDIGSFDLRAATLTADGLTSGRVVFAGTNGVLSDDSDLSFSGSTLSATNLTSSGTVSFGTLTDSGESIAITKFVDEGDAIASNDNDTTIPTSAAIKDYVDTQDAAIASDTLTFTNKTFDVEASGNSISNIDVADLKSGVLDTDISSVSSSDDTIASAKAIKTYVDSQVTAQDLDFQGDSGGALSIDLDSETLDIAGDGAGISTAGSGNQITISGNHDALTNFVANEHIDHSGVTLTAGNGLSGGGDITASRSFALDLNELSTETSIADADFIAMVDATDNASGKITFENLEDAIFASVSGDIAITEAGVATIQANSVAMATDTTGDFVNSITAGTGLTSTGATSGENISHSISVNASQTQITAVGALDAGSITSNFGNIDNGSSTANFGATTVDSLSVSYGNITNVGDIALDSISADTSTINVAIGDNTSDVFTIKQGSDKYFAIATSDSAENIAIGTGVSGTAISIGHSTSVTTVNDNLIVTGDLTVNGATSTISTTNTVVSDTLIELGNGTSGTPSNDAGIVIERGSADNAFIGFDESDDKFIVGTGSFTGASTGSLTITTGTLKANIEGNLDVSSSTLTTSAAQNLAIMQGAGANVDIGAFEMRAQTFESDVSTGTAPMVVASTTKVANLNADLLDDQTGSYYLDFGNFVIDNDEIPIAKLAEDSITIAGSSTALGGSITADTIAGQISADTISGNQINGGTIGSTTITTLTTAAINASTDIDIGSHGFRASTLTADSQTSGRVAIYGTNGLLTEDSDLTFSGDTLTATKLGAFTATGAINFDSQDMTNVDIDSGAIDGTNIGANSAGTGAFTTLSASTSLSVIGSSAFALIGRTSEHQVRIEGDSSSTFISSFKSGASSPIQFRTYDGSSFANVLQLSGTTSTFSGDLVIPEYIKHTDDTDTFIRFTDGSINFSADNTTPLVLDATGGTGVSMQGNVSIGSGHTPSSDFGFNSHITHIKKDGDISFILDNATEKFEFCMNNDASSLRIGAGSKNDILNLTANSNGVIGIGVAPDDEWDTFTAMQIGETGAIFAHPDGTGAGSAIHITANAYYDSQYEYLISASDEASRYTQENGKHLFYTAPAGTHGNAITFTEIIEAQSSQIKFSVPTFKLAETDGDANAGPIFILQRDNSASEDNGDVLGEIQFQGSDSNDDTTEYSTIHSRISNVSNTVEEGTIVFKNMVNGTSTEVMTLKGSALGIGTGDAVDEELHVEKSQNTLTRVKIENTNTGSSAQAQTNYVSDKGEFNVGIVSDAHSLDGAAILSNTANSDMFFACNNAEVMRIKADGNVGIGTSSPTGAKLQVESVLSGDIGIQVTQTQAEPGLFIDQDGNNRGLKVESTGSNNGAAIFSSNCGSSTVDPLVKMETENVDYDQPVLQLVQAGASNALEIVTSANASRAMEIINSDSTINSSDEMARFRFSGTGDPTGGRFIAFEDSQARMGMIEAANGTNVAYTVGTSDINTKKNFEEWDENVLDHFKALKPKRFHYKRQEDSVEKNKGYIAQDLKDAFPEAYPLSTYKEEDGDKQYYGFNPSGMVVYLMKAVQELSAKVEELEKKCENCC